MWFWYHYFNNTLLHCHTCTHTSRNVYECLFLRTAAAPCRETRDKTCKEKYNLMRNIQWYAVAAPQDLISAGRILRQEEFGECCVVNNYS